MRGLVLSQIDVKELTKENLQPGKFPADPRADFRLHISPDVRRAIHQHAKADASIEICGVLVGNWHKDENGPYVAVTDYIRCDNASSKFAEVTFTHESWAQINKEMDSRFANARIVGWYHSHPDFGIFLSDRDCFIHEHFFYGPGQVAYVVDPVRDLEGIFAWQKGKPTPLPHFWIGNSIRTVEASERNVAAEMAKLASTAGASASPQSDSSAPQYSSLGFATTAMGAMLLLILGYLYGGWRSQWERQTVADVAVAYFANPKILRPGLEENMMQVRERLKLLTDELAKLPKPAPDLTKEQTEEAAKRLKVIHDNLILCDTKLAEIAKTYGYSNEERNALLLYLGQMQSTIRQQEEARAQSAAAENASKTQPSATKADTAPSTATPPNALQPKTNEAGAPSTVPKALEAPSPDAIKRPPPADTAPPKK
jgi:proteasome lid subunit RPN8/RPN11